jgi:hypothetical protein
MKTFILFLLCLPLWAADPSYPSWRIERGLNLLKTWKAGVLEHDLRQVLTGGTNLFETELYCTGGVTSKVVKARFQGSGPFRLIEEVVATPDGTETNRDSERWTTFRTGGNQGAMVCVNGEERCQVVNYAVFLARWKTNGFESQCVLEDDRGTLTFWYRTNLASNPFFIGAWEFLEPGESKLVRVETPVDVIWHHVGVDRCRGCGKGCWLPGWPKPPALALNQGTVSFRGSPGASYLLESAERLGEWNPAEIFQASEDGTIKAVIPSVSAMRFFRFRLFSSATLTEGEAAEAWKAIAEIEP